MPNNGPVGSSSFPANGDTITFDVTITNPCYASTIPQLSFNPATAFQVTDGANGSQQFMRPENTVEVSTGLALICGTYKFEVFQDTSDTALSSAWAVVRETSTIGQYDLFVDTTVDASLITSQAT